MRPHWLSKIQCPTVKAILSTITTGYSFAYKQILFYSAFDFSGKPFDLMLRRVLCASSEALAKSIADICEHVDFPREDED